MITTTFRLHSDDISSQRIIILHSLGLPPFLNILAHSLASVIASVRFRRRSEADVGADNQPAYKTSLFSLLSVSQAMPRLRPSTPISNLISSSPRAFYVHQASSFMSTDIQHPVQPTPKYRPGVLSPFSNNVPSCASMPHEHARNGLKRLANTASTPWIHFRDTSGSLDLGTADRGSFTGMKGNLRTRSRF